VNEVKRAQNYINHVAIVLDASGSMSRLERKIVQVTDGLVSHLAQRSKEMNQETRITVYTFDDTARCVFYDMDALRLPSLSGHYRLGGRTALVDATTLALDDLAMTPEKYGDHSFLLYVITDGQENASSYEQRRALPWKLASLPSHWTVAGLVPDARGVHEAKQWGFAKDNIAVWDATSEHGVEEAGKVITASVDQYMTGRASGIRGTKSVFSTDASVLNAQSVAAANLTPVDPGTFVLVPVYHEMPISEFVEKAGYQFKVGTCYYQLNKSEKIHAQKDLMIRNKQTGQVFAGERVRDVIGLPRVTQNVSPRFNPDWEVFPQSTSLNRKLIPGTSLLIKTD